MKKIYVFFALLAIPFSLVSTPVYASSVYDSAYQITDTINISNTKCPDKTIDIGLSWVSYITDSSKWPSGTDYTAVKDSFLTSLNTGSWGVTSYSGGYAQVYWVETGNIDINWYESAVLTAPTTPLMLVQIGIDSNSGGCLNDGIPVIMGFYTGQTYVTVSSSNGNVKNYLLSNIDSIHNYPPGYAGTLVRGSLPPSVPDITNDITVTTEYNGKRISVRSTTPNPPLDDSLYWCSWNITNNLVSSEDLVTYYSTPGYREPSGSAWGVNSCVDTIEFDVDTIPTVVHVEFRVHDDDQNDVGGIAFNVNIDGTTASVTNWDSHSETKSDYEDCSTYGWDVAQRLTCEIQNLGLKVRDFGIWLFTPSQSRIQAILSGDANTFGLTSIIVAPIGLLTSMSVGQTCQPLSLPLPFVDTNLTLPCMGTIYSTYLGAFFTIYQVVATALIGYWISVRVLADVKGFKDPHNDKIEVLDL